MPKKVYSFKNTNIRKTESEKRSENGFACISYVQGIFEAVSQVLSDLNIQVCFKPVNTLRKILSHPKDHVHMMSKSNVVYKVKCADCDASNVGETKRRLETRIAEHRKAIEKVTATLQPLQSMHGQQTIELPGTKQQS